MEFDSNIVTEITAPNTVPFLPGNDIIGIGADIPSELDPYGIAAAIIFYSSSWDPAATTPKVKYYAFFTKNGSIGMAVCYSNNPSTTAADIKQLWGDDFVTTGAPLHMINHYSWHSADALISAASAVILRQTYGENAFFWKMLNTVATPANDASYGQFFVQGGALKYKGTANTVTTIAPA